MDWVDEDDGDDDDDDDGGDRNNEEKNDKKKTVRLLDYACGTGVGKFDLVPVFTLHGYWISSRVYCQGISRFTTEEEANRHLNSLESEFWFQFSTSSLVSP